MAAGGTVNLAEWIIDDTHILFRLIFCIECIFQLLCLAYAWDSVPAVKFVAEHQRYRRHNNCVFMWFKSLVYISV